MKIQTIYKKLSVNYMIVSLTISFITFLVYLAFSKISNWLPLDFGTLVVSTAMSILIGYEFALIIYIVSKIYPTFQKLCPLFQNNDCQIFLDNFQFNLKKFCLLCLTILIILTPFTILTINRFLIWKIFKGMSNEVPPFFSLVDHTTCALLLDIFNNLVGCLIIILLAIIVWIIIELTFSLTDLQKKYEVKINIFEVEEIGGLKPLNTFMLFILGNYFVIIALIILSYTPPNETIYYHIYSKLLITPEIIILLIMLFIGVIYFIVTQITVQRLIDKGIEPELKKINIKRTEIFNKTIEICSEKRTNGNIIKLRELQIITDLLEKEEMRIKQIQNKKFDLKILIKFLTTILIPIFSLIFK
jgi:hypothetical protein